MGRDRKGARKGARLNALGELSGLGSEPCIVLQGLFQRLLLESA